MAFLYCSTYLQHSTSRSFFPRHLAPLEQAALTVSDILWLLDWETRNRSLVRTFCPMCRPSHIALCFPRCQNRSAAKRLRQTVLPWHCNEIFRTPPFLFQRRRAKAHATWTAVGSRILRPRGIADRPGFIAAILRCLQQDHQTVPARVPWPQGQVAMIWLQAWRFKLMLERHRSRANEFRIGSDATGDRSFPISRK